MRGWFTLPQGGSSGSMANDWKGNQFHPYSTLAPPISHIALPGSVWKICRLRDFHCVVTQPWNVLGASQGGGYKLSCETVWNNISIWTQILTELWDTRCNLARTKCINPSINWKLILQCFTILIFNYVKTSLKLAWSEILLHLQFAFKVQSPA